MKKSKLKLQYFNNAELLTRIQLKNVLGGSALVVTVAGCCKTKYVNSEQYTDSKCPSCIATGELNYSV